MLFGKVAKYETVLRGTGLNRGIDESFGTEADIFKSLAHPTRLYVLHAIRKRRLSVSDLSAEAGVDISTMSKHLEVLKRQGIISGEKVNNQVFYSLRVPCVLDFMKCARRVINGES